MARQAKAQHGGLVPWLSARDDNKEKRFIQVGNTLVFSKRFQGLPDGAKYLYLCMAMECGGKRDFRFPRARFRKYGFSDSSFYRYITVLKAQGFIIYRSGFNTRTPNEYRFTFEWKQNNV